MGVMQHHDAVTGTEKQLVADDYARLLHKSMQQGLDIVANAIRYYKYHFECYTASMAKYMAPANRQFDFHRSQCVPLKFCCLIDTPCIYI